MSYIGKCMFSSERLKCLLCGIGVGIGTYVHSIHVMKCMMDLQVIQSLPLTVQLTRGFNIQTGQIV